MSENIILFVLRVVGGFSMCLGITWHMSELGLANGQSEANSKLIVFGWTVWLIYWVLSLSEKVLSWGAIFG